MASTTEVSFTQDLPITAWPLGSGLPLHAYGGVRTCTLVETASPARDSSRQGPPSYDLAVSLGEPTRPAPWYDTDTDHLMTVQQIVNVALAHRDVLSGGALVLEGKEPMFQATFASALLHVCRESGIRTELVTSGADHGRVNDRMFQETDLTTITLPALPDRMGGDAHDAVGLIARLEHLGRPMRLQLPVLTGADLDSRDVGILAEALSKLSGLQSIEVYDCEDPATMPPTGQCHRHRPRVRPVSATAVRLEEALRNIGLNVEGTSTQTR